jgi:hypothetical protein
MIHSAVLKKLEYLSFIHPTVSKATRITLIIINIINVISKIFPAGVSAS